MILPCPLCQARFDVPDELLDKPGTIIRCPKCKFSFALRDQFAGSQGTPGADTDPAVDQALVDAVREAAAEELDEDTAPTDVDISPELVERVRAEAAAHGGTVDEEADVSDTAPTQRMSRSPSTDDAEPAAEEIELEEVDPEVRPLTPEELAKLNVDEIVDADDLAQLAETSGETEARARLNPKAEAEAAGQWPSIIVEDHLLASAATDREPEAKSQEPSAEKVLARQRQAYEQAHRRAVAAQRAVNALSASGPGGRADPAKLARAQKELRLALTQLQIAQQRYEKAQAEFAKLQREAAQQPAEQASISSPAPVTSQASAPAAGAGSAPASPGSGGLPSPGVGVSAHSGVTAEDEVLEPERIGASRGWMWGLGGLVVLAVGAVAAYFALRGSPEPAVQKGARTSQGTRTVWQDLDLRRRRVKLVRRPGRSPVVVVEAVLTNKSKSHEFRNPFIEARLLESGRVTDSMVVPCGGAFDEKAVVEIVNEAGRQGFETALRKLVARTAATIVARPNGGQVVCQAVLFPSTPSGESIEVRVRVDQNKTIAAPAE